MYRLAPSSSSLKAVWLPSWLTFLRAAGPHESGMNRFRHTLSGFPDIFSSVILHFSGDIGDGSLCNEIFLWSAIAVPVFPPLPIDNRFFLCSL
jgi:hypothetical protein